MTVGVVLRKEGARLDPAGVEQYQALIGGLLYLSACTRPDIAFAVGRLARYASEPTEAHAAAAKTVLRYLRGTTHWGLCYSGAKALTGYCDADFGGDLDTRRSTSGYSFMLKGAAISWMSKVQPTVAASTTEAEYIAAAAAAKEAVWLKALMGELTGDVGAVPLLCDNQSAIWMIKSPGGTARSKHIDVAHHFVRDRAERGDLAVSYVPTEEMVADALTKTLPGEPLRRCRQGLGMTPGPHDGRPGGSVGAVGAK